MHDERGVRHLGSEVEEPATAKTQGFGSAGPQLERCLGAGPSRAKRFLAESRNGSYGAAVACIDWSLDVLLHELEALGLVDDTIVVFTSDNGALARSGEGSNAPLRDKKGTTWEGGQRVPCIVRYPGVVPAGAECAEVATAMDLYPTIAGWCGVDVPAEPVIGDGMTDFEAYEGGAADRFIGFGAIAQREVVLAAAEHSGAEYVRTVDALARALR